MKKYPIIFSPEMVGAILEGRKTQTRRIITPHNSVVGEGSVDWSKFCWDGSELHHELFTGDEGYRNAPLPFADGEAERFGEYLHVPYNWADQAQVFRVYCRYEVGDRLWVKETFAFCPEDFKDTRGIIYKADNKYNEYVAPYEWHPSIFMPRRASRLTLEIAAIRGQRLQGITEEDALAEGCESAPGITSGGNIGLGSAKYWYKQLWDSLNAKRGHPWEKNDLVWAFTFRKIE